MRRNDKTRAKLLLLDLVILPLPTSFQLFVINVIGWGYLNLTVYTTSKYEELIIYRKNKAWRQFGTEVWHWILRRKSANIL